MQRPKMAVAATLGTVAILFLALVGSVQLLPQFIGAEELGPPTYPFGKGRVLVLGDSVLELIPPEREGGEWQVDASDVWKPSGALNRVHGPYRTPTGSLRWFGEYFIGPEPPFVQEFFEGGGVDTLFQSPGDDGFADLAPDGATALLVREDIASPSYRRDLIRFSPSDLAPTVLYAAAEMVNQSAWSPNGQKIMTSLTGAVDTLLVLNPSGGETGRWTFPQFRFLNYSSWCADSRHTVFIGLGPDPGCWNVPRYLHRG